MQLRLGQDIHAVMIDGDAVFLDVRSDAYFCLPGVGAVLAVRGTTVSTPEASLAEGLCAAGLATTEPCGPDRPPPPPAPLRTARALIVGAAHERAPARPRHWRAVAKAALEASAGRRKRFDRLLPAPPSLEPSRVAPAPGATLLRDLAIFRRIAPWLPLDGLCLYRSHLLRAYLTALGHRVDWMFGVRTWPFRAHCWLQAGDVALDDEAERVLAYHPIMVR